MATSTPKLGLRKPAGSDTINVVTDIAENADKLDAPSHTAAAATDDITQSKVTGDSNPRYLRNADGKLEWGPGNAALDVALERVTGGLKVTGTLEATGIIKTKSFVGCKALKNVTQAGIDTNGAAIQWDATDAFDSDAFHDPASNNTRITIPTGKAGKYRFAAKLGVSASSEAFFKKNGATSYSWEGASADLKDNISGSDFGGHMELILNLSVGDYIEVIVKADTGTISVWGGGASGEEGRNEFVCEYLGA